MYDYDSLDNIRDTTSVATDTSNAITPALFDKLLVAIDKQALASGYSSYGVFGTEETEERCDDFAGFGARYEGRQAGVMGTAYANASVGYIEQLIRTVEHWGAPAIVKMRMLWAVCFYRDNARGAEMAVKRMYNQWRDYALGNTENPA